MLSIIAAHPVLSWFLFGIFCLVLELVMPGFFIFFFGLGAWCAALAGLVPHISMSAQILVFLVASIALLILLRAKFQKLFIGGARDVDTNDDFVPQGDLVEVVEDIVPPAAGKVKYGGSFWRAVSARPVASGERVRVVAKNNLILTVEAVQVETTEGE